MSEITAVPLRPIAKGSLTRLWVGVAIAALAGAGLAYAGTEGVIGKSPAGFMTANADEAGVITKQSGRSEEHTSELQSLMRISYAVFCLNKKNKRIAEHAHTLNSHQTKLN